MLLIENLQADFKTIGMADGVDVRLMPGVNEVAPARWATAKKHPVVQHWIKTKAVRVVGTKDLPALDRATACDIVASTFDLDLLRKWEVLKMHPEVTRAVKMQIEEMTTMPDPDKPAAE